MIGRALPSAAALVVGTVLTAACTGSTPTQVVVHLEADPAPLGRAAALRVQVIAEADPDPPAFDMTRSLVTDPPEVTLPATVPLVPREGDSSRRYRLLAELVDGGGVAFNRERLVGGYVEGELREVTLLFEAACDDVDCAESETCVAGVCQPACLDVATGGRVPCEAPACAGVRCDPCERCMDGSCVPEADGAACGGGRCFEGACCTGCLESGECLTGDALDACGGGGLPCEACRCDGDRCVDGSCTPAEEAISLSAGNAHTCLTLSGDGTVICWGDDSRSQIGTDGAGVEPLPVPARGGAGLRRAAAGGQHTCALRFDNGLICWGANDSAQIGNVMPGVTPVTVPFEVEPGRAFVDLAASEGHTCAVADDGALLCWGQNSQGQSGITTKDEIVNAPTQVGTETDWRSVSSRHRHTCALRDSGALYCWGYNLDGELGLGDVAMHREPTEVTPGMTYRAVAPGSFHTCAIGTDGVLRCWGGNPYGQIGRGMFGDVTDPDEPRPVAGSLAPDQITSGRSHACAIVAPGELYCFGLNDHGQLGLGHRDDQASPTRVGQRSDWRSVGAGDFHTCGVTGSGAIYCWGMADMGRLGTGDTMDVTTPSRVCLPP